MSKKIIIVDDHTLFAQSLQILVNSFQEYEVTHVMKNGKELVDYIKANKVKPDIVLLDIRMPIMDGLDTMAWLQQNNPAQKVLALTMEHDEETIIKMLQFGCRGYLLKDIEPREFLFALEEVMQNGYFYSDEANHAIEHQNNPKTFENVTAREMEFIELACTEKTYKEIAEVMNLSPKTIDGYRESLFSKLHLKSRVGLVVFAIKNGIIKV